MKLFFFFEKYSGTQKKNSIKFGNISILIYKKINTRFMNYLKNFRLHFKLLINNVYVKLIKDKILIKLNLHK